VNARSIRSCTCRLNELDRDSWSRLSPKECRSAAEEVVSVVRSSTLEQRVLQRHLPRPVSPIMIEELILGTRTFNCLAALRKTHSLFTPEEWQGLTIKTLLALPGFGAKSLVDFLVSFESADSVEQDAIQQCMKSMDAELLMQWANNPTHSVPTRLLDTFLPMPTTCRRLSDLGLDYRTATRLATIGLDRDLSGLSRVRVADLIGLPGFGLSSLVKLLKAISNPVLANLDAHPEVGNVEAPTSSRVIEEELNAAVTVAASRCGSETSNRNATIAIMYFGWNGEYGTTLQQIADVVGLTRERVRQICTRIATRMSSRQLAAPRLEAAIREVESLCPRPAEDIERQLQKLGIARTPFRLEGLLNAARILGCRVAFGIIRVRGQRMAIRGDEARRIREVIRCSEAAVRSRGTATVREIAMLASEVTSEEVSEDLVTVALECVESLQWLDNDKVWFTVRHVRKNRVVSRIRKILSVSPEIHVSELRRGVARHRVMDGYAPPSRVLLEMCSKLDWCIVDGDTVRLSTPGTWAFAIRGVERQIAEILRHHGGVMHRNELDAACADAGITSATTQMHLSNSPILDRLAVGIYALRGERIDTTAVERIKRKYSEREWVRLDHGWTTSGAVWITYKLSHAIVSTGVIGLPGAMRQFLEGKFQLMDSAGVRVGDVSIRSHNAWGLGPFFRRRDVEVGDTLYVEFDLRARSAIVRVGSTSSLDHMLSGD